MANILIACCPHDPPTTYGYYYLRTQITPLFSKYGHRVVFLKTANLQNFRYALQKHDPDFVILNGHGGFKAVKGCNDNILLNIKSYDPIFNTKMLRQNPEWMKGRIVYLFTCNTGRELAQALIRYGASAVAAYRSPFFFLSEDRGTAATDEKAYPYFASALQLPVMLAQGRSFAEGCAALKTSFKLHLAKAEARRDTLAAKYLYHNLINFVVYGNTRVSLYQMPVLFAR